MAKQTIPAAVPFGRVYVEYLHVGQASRGRRKWLVWTLRGSHWCWIPFLSWFTHSLWVFQSDFWPFVANTECCNTLWECWHQSLPVVLFAVWYASFCGPTKTSSPRHDAWSDSNLQKPAQTQKERQWVHLQQQDSQITPHAHQSIHVHIQANAQIVFI